METGSNLITQIYTSRKILLNLLKGQGFDIKEYDKFSINEVDAMYQQQQLDMLLERTDETGQNLKTYVRYYLKMLRPAHINDIIEDLFINEEILTSRDTLMVITVNSINETITQLLKHIYERDGKFIIIYNMRMLQFNILENVLVPNHRILTMPEILVVKQKYNITSDFQWPDISRFDPVAQVIGMRPGQICEITRPSKTAIEGKSYRICLNI